MRSTNRSSMASFTLSSPSVKRAARRSRRPLGGYAKPRAVTAAARGNEDRPQPRRRQGGEHPNSCPSPKFVSSFAANASAAEQQIDRKRRELAHDRLGPRA